MLALTGSRWRSHEGLTRQPHASQEDTKMHSSFADQLAGLDLSSFSIGSAPVSCEDFPLRDAVVQTLEAVWSDLFAMVSSGRVRVDVKQRFRLEEAAEAHRALEARQTAGSTVLTV